MGGDDPHIHVRVKAVPGDVDIRNMLAVTFGLAGDLPAAVTTGCGQRVPFAMTSTFPEKVTCLACREHAHRTHLRLADEVERLGRMPGSTLSDDQASRAAQHHRDLARKFVLEDG